ncbi:putative UDP-glucose flavonoid 3-O-glucosyltransferase 6-like [Capsicum annuum]|nr:putative UDP-glucose flavonoid 3-O-glucosyltransferase 6-like [Capsicum annuum]
MASSDSSFWKEAADSDIDSILRNYMWELVDLPPGNKPLGSKWIFQRKMKADGTIDKYKARLVVKGFKHKEGLDYFDTYSPVTRITSIQMLIALVAVYDLEIHQIDMKTAFLNGELEEEIYIEQPKDFVVLGKENKAISALSPERNFFSIIKAFAAGVILSRGFIHVLPDAFDKLTSPYLKELPWKKFSFGGFVAMVSAMGTLMVDTYATSYYNKRSMKSGLVAQSGDEVGVIHAHSHGHVHSAAPIMGESVSELLRYRVISQAGVDPRCSRGSPEPPWQKITLYI